MKKAAKNLFFFFVLTAMPAFSYAQVAIQNLTIRPAILCAGAAATITFQAALPGNSTGSQDISLMGSFSTATGVTNANSYVFIHDNTVYTTTFNDTLETGATFATGSWATINPPFSNFVTYTAITTVPPYANGTVVYVTIGANNNFYQAGSNLTMAASVQAPVTVDCTSSDAINTGAGVFVNAGVTYTGQSNAVTVLISSSGCSTNTSTSTQTPTNTESSTNTSTKTSTETSTPTVTNTQTSTVTRTETNTITPSPTSTNTNTQTNTQTVTNTATIVDTNTSTNTSTATVTRTNTNTITPSPTSTNTNTHTVTQTSTNTITASPTSTDTNTQTNTSTPLADTATNTNTPTNTNTATNTNTLQDTATSTNTQTSTNTLADTATDTNTVTVTNTMTSTSTSTPTLVNTATNTQSSTSSATNTATLVNTFTSTNTGTSTTTRTATSSVTSTQTQTNTSTVTATQTSTNTPASAVSMVKVASETQARSGDDITYTITITISGNTLTNTIVTDVLPANISFVRFGNYPTGTLTQNVNGTLTWNLPSSLAPGVYTLTYLTQVNSFAQADVPLTNHAQLNYSGGSTLNAYAPITVIGNFSVAINIYNSAGEVVKTIPLQQFSTAINNISLSTTNTISTLQGPGSSINIIFDGIVIGTWDGTNNQGLPVSNGNYTVQIDNIGASGTVTSVSQKAIVNRAIANVEVDIFNESGEVVRRLYNVMSNPVGTSMTNVVLSAGVIKPNFSAPVSTTNNQSQITITILDSSTPVILTWDGTNDSDSLVSPGEYQVQVHWTDGGGNTTDITKTVLVLPSSGPSGKVIARPNEIQGSTTYTTFDASGVSGAAQMKVRIYTVAGELVQVLPSATTTVVWTPPGLASGLYIANVEVDNANGGLLSRQNVKVLILH